MRGNFVSLYKTPKKGENSILKLKCDWISDELNVLVIDGNTAWSGKFSAEEIESFCEMLGITRDEYITECQQAFSGGKAVENFSFTVENNRFVWRKELEADTRVKFGSIKLSPVPLVQALEEFVDFAFETIECCRQEVLDAKNKMGYFEKERMTLVQKIEEYTQNKKEIENILYSKFLCVLNSKKERIASLEQELSDLKSKTQHSANESESDKCGTAVITGPSSKTTRITRKTNKKPYQRRVRESPPSVAVDAELQVSSDIPVENNDTQTTNSNTSKELKNKQNVRQTSQQRTKTNSLVENRTISCKREALVPCTSRTLVEQVCESDVSEHTGSTQHQPSKNSIVQQKTLVVRSASPVASTGASVIPVEDHFTVKNEIPDQFVPEQQGMSISLQTHADQKSPLLVKKGIEDLISERTEYVAGSLHSSETKDKTTQKISEVICAIDLVSQKTSAQANVPLNNVKKLTITKNDKKVVTSPAKRSKEFEIICPLDKLKQPISPTSSLIHKDTARTPKTNTLKRPIQSMNMQDNSHELSREGTDVSQETDVSSADGVNTNSRINAADAISVTMSSANPTKRQTERESNHYDSETDVDEPEDVCKLSAKHRSVNGILEDSNLSSLTESENLEVRCDEVHQPERKKTIENLLNDSQDSDSTSEEIPEAPLPKRTRRSERFNKCVPISNKSINHFTKLSHIQDKSQNVVQNVHSVLYEQETQIVDTQKLLDGLG
ncbi:uncharacterized protein LOC126468422 isoform X1 [Schistocerca serialis cubense]|uniref:uncharacterized protein LOC126468422 isoform X1 n=2 Tax=Schistocerca serialis cubense TaxID=2023355 RepID=UPI00214F2319|nr:uncharacterized protein LOC126468422 isoform X1 [Schistocerca serialis cubense]